MGVRGQSHAVSALPPGRRPVTQCSRGWVGPRASLDRCGKSQSLYQPCYLACHDDKARKEWVMNTHIFLVGWSCPCALWSTTSWRYMLGQCIPLHILTSLCKLKERCQLYVLACWALVPIEKQACGGHQSWSGWFTQIKISCPPHQKKVSYSLAILPMACCANWAPPNYYTLEYLWLSETVNHIVFQWLVFHVHV